MSDEIEKNTPAIPRIMKLHIKNFGCFDEKGVSVDINKIVVIVGENNIGKSTILRAFEVVTTSGKLTLEDFHDRNDANKPEIIIHSLVVKANKPGDEWCIATENKNEWEVQEKWVWEKVNIAPTRYGWLKDPASKDGYRWANDNDKEKCPWGASNVAKSKRPDPHRINTFDSPSEQEKKTLGLLDALIDTYIDLLLSNENNEKDAIKFKKDIEKIKEYKGAITESQKKTTDMIEEEVNKVISNVFKDHKFYIKRNDDFIRALFKNNYLIEVGSDECSYPLSKQGSGTQRTVLWSILKTLTDKKALLDKKTKPASKNISNILLIDEPELSLHPTAAANVRDVLYNLANTDGWQVMITTHSPEFIDLSKDHTTIIRVERKDGDIKASTLFSPEKAKLDGTDKERLKLENSFDSHISKAFFGGDVLVIEGDTEYSIFNYIKMKELETGNNEYLNLNIIRARGKVTVASMMKVLNHFKKKYYVLHDSDTQTCFSKRRVGAKTDALTIEYKKIEQVNGAWTNNEKIMNEMTDRSDVYASIINFEDAYLSEIVSSDKPSHSIEIIKSDNGFYKKMKCILDIVLGKNEINEENKDKIIKWKKMDDLNSAYEIWKGK
ncbi:ATP-dependent nuclease [Kluyvera sichuanensis]|uniref:ATP-dependent nuclease n=1 Tax=Kluyvera sichuanensis TaxID=2725494 RepID=UPI0034A19B0D